MKYAIAVIATLMCGGCAVTTPGGLHVNLVCNKTLVDRDGLHYKIEELNHLHCDYKKWPVTFNYSF